MKRGHGILAGLAAAVAAFAGASAVDTERTGSTGTPPGAGALPRLSPETDRRVRATLASLPLRFEANRGQVAEPVRFVHRAPGYTLFLTPDEAVLNLQGADRPAVLRTRLVGGAPAAAVTGEGEQRGRTNYLRGSDPAGWTTGVASYGKVRCSGVYPGIDLVYHGTEGILEYDFVLAPGADPGRIALDIQGADSMDIDGAGDLVLATPAGEVRQHAPRVYQEVAGVRRAVEGRYSVRDGGAVGFEVGPYDADRPLVIDPTLVYATYLGGNSSEYPKAIAMDAAGSVYLTGYTYSTDFPTVSPFQGSNNGTLNVGYGDAFVTKLDPAGTSVVYSTYLGGVGDDVGFGIAVDASGSAYVTGTTYGYYVWDFPVTGGAFQTVVSKNAPYSHMAFVTKLAPDGATLSYSTFLGGDYDDYGYDIAVDGSGNAYITGKTWSVNFPTTPGAMQGTHEGAQDAFVTKLNPSGTGLVYSTFLGGDNNYDAGYAIAVDASGSAVVAGQTNSTNFPTANALQPAIAPNDNPYTPYDGFVARLNAAGSALLYSTFLGGNSADIIYDLALDASGNAYLAGETFSTNYPTTSGAYEETNLWPGGRNSFVTKINAGGSALAYSTYTGFHGPATGIAVDGSGNAFVAAYDGEPQLLSANPILGAQEPGYSGVLMKLNAAGSAPVYSTLVGSVVRSDSGKPDICVAVDATGVAVVAEYTASTAQVGTPGAFQASAAVPYDCFVLKIHPLTAPVAPTGLAAAAATASQVDLTWTDASGEETAYEVERSIEGGAFAPLATLGADAASYSDTGRDPLRTHAYRVRATNSAGASAFVVSGDATTPGTMNLVAVKGKLLDAEGEASDSFKAYGTLALNGLAEDQAFDPAADGLEVDFGNPADPFVVVVPPGGEGWKAKNGKYTWKSAKGESPRVKLVLDLAKGKFSVSAKAFDLPGAPGGQVRVSFRCGNDAGMDDSAWTPSPKTPGLLVR